jgi:hypothetical protein
MDKLQLLKKIENLLTQLQNQNHHMQNTKQVYDVDIKYFDTSLDYLNSLWSMVIKNRDAFISEGKEPTKFYFKEELDKEEEYLNLSKNMDEVLKETDPEVAKKSEEVKENPKTNNQNIFEQLAPGTVPAKMTSESNRLVNESEEILKKANDSLNERLHIREDNSLLSKLQSQPILSLKKAISINDKARFIRELFDKDKSLYDSTITALDDSPNETSARTYIRENFNWKDNPDEAEDFFLYLIRRFSKEK